MSLPLISLAELADSLHNCQRCQLAKLGRTQVVFGVGNPHASVMFVGEAPGFFEDQKGEPFVGAAGQLLNELLQSVGLSRADIYIANVIKCRPPNNRNPEADEIARCEPYLIRQIEAILQRAPYGMNSGWSSWEDGMSSAAQDVTKTKSR